MHAAVSHGENKSEPMMRSLDEAVASGEPLIDIVVVFKEGVDYELATRAVNCLGSDIELHTSDWYGSARMRIGAVTAEGALRLFGARFTRVPLERWDSQTNNYEGVHKDYFRWSSTEITEWPSQVDPYVASISATQPGADDDGQAYVPLFET
jgi:hypothetical protein